MKKYAAFFEWRPKDRKELGVVEELCNALRAAGRSYAPPRVHKPDPPDCVSEDDRGNPVAIEVSELVCSAAAAAVAQGKDVMRLWKPGDLKEHIGQSLKDKDEKTYLGGPYNEIVICLHTDEPLLTKTLIEQELSGTSFGPFTQITSAYLVKSYDPHSSSYPYWKLPLST